MKDIVVLANENSLAEIIRNWELLEQNEGTCGDQLDISTYSQQFIATENRRLLVVYQAQIIINEDCDQEIFKLFKKIGIPVTFPTSKWVLKKILILAGLNLLVLIKGWLVKKFFTGTPLVKQFEDINAEMINIRQQRYNAFFCVSSAVKKLNRAISFYNVQLSQATDLEKNTLEKIPYYQV